MTSSHRPQSGQAPAVPARTGPGAVQDQIRRLREEGGTYRSIAAADGQAVTMCAPSRNSEYYQRFLQKAEDANPDGQIVIITDNLSSHDSKSTRAWLEGHPRIRHAFIPKGAC